MKNLAAFCLLVVLSAAAHAQVSPAPDSTPKPKPLEPVLERDHRGQGRIGVTLTFPKDGGPPQIASLIRGGPAADAGFKVGDVIIKIDKNYTSTLSNSDVDLSLRGRPGMGVELTVQRGDNPRYIVRALDRRVIPENADNVLDPLAIPSSPELKP